MKKVEVFNAAQLYLDKFPAEPVVGDDMSDEECYRLVRDGIYPQNHLPYMLWRAANIAAKAWENGWYKSPNEVLINKDWEPYWQQLIDFKYNESE